MMPGKDTIESQTVTRLKEKPKGEVRTHVWGVDVSGTRQGAGGGGGLLATIIHTGTNAVVYLPVYDGNGNVMGYVRAADGVLVAQYEYGPFGELLRATGPLSHTFNYLFSTKYHDWETGLYYYGHRYYSPSTGRWLSRDPIREDGGVNLYGFTGNNSINYIDFDGRFTATKRSSCGQWYQGYHKRPGPPQKYPEGFALCKRSWAKDSKCDCVAMAANALGGEHSYIQYVGPMPPVGPQWVWGYGWGGHATAEPEVKFNPNNCVTCKKTSGTLKNGSATGKNSYQATDMEIMDCIKNHKPSKSYNPFGYNCRGWAKDAANNCGLDCN